MKLTQAQIRELFEYIPYQGILRKKTKHTSKKPITSRYVHIKVGERIHNVTTATIIWTYMKGVHSPYVQRIDKDHSNNHWLNFKG